MFKTLMLGFVAAATASDTGDLINSVGTVRDAIATARSNLGDAAMSNEEKMDALLSSVGGIGDSYKQVDDLILDARNLGGQHTELTDRVTDEVSIQNAQIKAKIDAEWMRLEMEQTKDMEDLDAELIKNITMLNAANQDREAASAVSIASYQKTTNDVVAALKLTHYANKKAPVYRWNFWDNYLNTGMGWYDGNNPRSFGGTNPSRWGDGNVRADQMHDNMSFLKRLFSKPGFGDEGHGSNVCAMQQEIPHSTNDLRCGALFRIKNVATGTINWSINWSYTGWSGWGGQATCAVRKRNVWSGSCHGSCNRDNTFSIPGNSAKNRVSTVVFVAGSAYPYGNYNHHRVTMLQFNNLKLPNNLEFVDDMSTVPGTDKWSA